MHEWERIRSLPSKDKLEKAWKILEEEVWSENESVWEMNNHRHIEKDRRNERRIAKEKYINPSVMLDSWGIGRYWGSYWGRYRGSGRRQLRYRETKNQIQEQKLDRSTKCREGRSFLDRSIRYRGGVEIVLRKMLEKLDK